ncbi:hypothetical protein [Methanosarcina sp. MTP4]|nr:hypothetical protein [Methanosarcina sp. MTP4]
MHTQPFSGLHLRCDRAIMLRNFELPAMRMSIVVRSSSKNKY